MAAITICSDLEPPQNKVCHCFHCFPIYFPLSDGTRCHDLSLCTLCLQPTVSLSSFTFIKRLFSSSLLSASKVVSSANLRLLIYLSAILTPACALSSPAFHMMCSAYKLNKHTSLPILTYSFVILLFDILLSQFGTSLLFHVQF